MDSQLILLYNNWSIAHSIEDKYIANAPGSSSVMCVYVCNISLSFKPPPSPGRRNGPCNVAAQFTYLYSGRSMGEASPKVERPLWRMPCQQLLLFISKIVPASVPLLTAAMASRLWGSNNPSGNGVPNHLGLLKVRANTWNLTGSQSSSQSIGTVWTPAWHSSWQTGHAILHQLQFLATSWDHSETTHACW